jgi:hypothetical protein
MVRPQSIDEVQVGGNQLACCMRPIDDRRQLEAVAAQDEDDRDAAGERRVERPLPDDRGTARRRGQSVDERHEPWLREHGTLGENRTPLRKAGHRFGDSCGRRRIRLSTGRMCTHNRHAADIDSAHLIHSLFVPGLRLELLLSCEQRR